MTSPAARFKMVYGRAKADRLRLLLIYGNLAVGLLLSGGFFAWGFRGMPAPFVNVFVAMFMATLVAISALTAIGFWHARQATITVGADGIYVHHFFVKKFVPYREIKEIRHEGDDVIIAQHDFTTHELTGRKDAAVLADALSRAIAAYRANAEESARLLGRRGRPLSQWMQDARGLTEQNATYRAATMPDEQLWRVVEDGSAAPTERAAAALALRLDPPGKARLRIAASACAEERLRVALDAVASDAPSLEAALAELDDPADMVRRAVTR